MRNTLNKTMIASLAAVTMGFALAGSAGSAFADGSRSNNTFNPLMPYAASNAGEIGSFSAGGSSAALGSIDAVGSIDADSTFVSVVQGGVYCHLLTNYKRPTC